jgi:hypothetical protein
MRTLLDHRALLTLALSLCAALVGTHLVPFPVDHPILRLIDAAQPTLFLALEYGYAAAWWSTSFLALTVIASVCYVCIARIDRAEPQQRLPAYPAVSKRRSLFLVLGERHRTVVSGRSPEPRWLTIPDRGLYTGIAIIGAIGSGKTSACMYPYVDQLLGYNAADPAHKLGGLILEVKGDFCRQVRGILERHGRAADYVEVSLTSPYRYNPLHNDLDAYALAFGIATLMTNLFGRGKEPFWQQASTNLVKFVILLHQVLDDYVTLFDVYEHVINPDKLRTKIASGLARFGAQNRRIFIAKHEYLVNAALTAWDWHDDETGNRTWAHWSQELQDAATPFETSSKKLPWIRPGTSLA